MKKNGTMPTQQTTTVPTGVQMVMRTLGLDPVAITASIEAAKGTAAEVMAHFETRLNAIDEKLEEILSIIRKVN